MTGLPLVLFVMAYACAVGWAVPFIFWGNRTGLVITLMVIATLTLLLQHFSGAPALADDRLHDEQWRLLSVAPLEDNHFLLSVRYAGGDIRTYRLDIADQGQRDAFLKAQQALKRGRALTGKADRGRAGLTDDSEMQFAFKDVPDSNPKEPPQ